MYSRGSNFDRPFCYGAERTYVRGQFGSFFSYRQTASYMCIDVMSRQFRGPAFELAMTTKPTRRFHTEQFSSEDPPYLTITF